VILPIPIAVTERRVASSLAPLLLLAFAACASPSRSRTDSSRTDAKEQTGPSDERRPSANTLYSMSRILSSQSKDAEAETVLTRLIAEHPDFMPAYSDLAELYLRHERVDSAVEVLKTGIKVAPEDAVLQNDLGMCRLTQGRYEEALDSFTAAAAGAPQDARARANMAVALGMLGRLDESLALYLQLVSPSEAHFNLGVLCEARKDTQRAAQEFEIAESLRTGKGTSAKDASARK
jgi:Flp pilus assembly protein TadD